MTEVDSELNVLPVILPEPKPTWWVWWGNFCSHPLVFIYFGTFSICKSSLGSIPEACILHKACSMCNLQVLPLLLIQTACVTACFFFLMWGIIWNNLLGSFTFSRTLCSELAQRYRMPKAKPRVRPKGCHCKTEEMLFSSCVAPSRTGKLCAPRCRSSSLYFTFS